MSVRTFYWDPTTPSSLRTRVRDRVKGHRPRWVTGNAGDLFNVDLIRWAYPGHDAINVSAAGERLLLVGSIARVMEAGDLICGIGSKGPAVPPVNGRPLSIRGLRGPLTLEAFRDSGHDVSGIEFLGDPGLLIGRIFPDLMEIEPEPNRVIFIPHYRQRPEFSSTRQYEVVDIDATARDIATAIRRAEFVHTSSLHGLIWAHALGRPTQLVTPPAEEPEFKYRDYAESVGMASATPLTLEESIRTASSISPHDVTAVIDSINLPTVHELSAVGILT